MPETKQIEISALRLDLANFRMPPQPDEVQAIRSMIAMRPNRFWALTESLLADGYLPTENILVIRLGDGSNNLTVKEGNRRIAAMKLIHGQIDVSKFII